MSGCLRHTTIGSPVGDLLLVGDGAGLRGVYPESGRRPQVGEGTWVHDPGSFASVESQLAEYFDGERTAFDLELVVDGTPFQNQVWRAVEKIGYGETAGYGEVAERIGRPAAARAVGAANGANPLSIVIPCHRLVGSNGDLTGYSGGLEAKARLLELETFAIYKGA